MIDVVDDTESRLTQLKIDRVVTRADRADSDPFGPATVPGQIKTPHSASDLKKYSMPPMPYNVVHQSGRATTVFQPSMPWNVELLQHPRSVMPGYGGWGVQPRVAMTTNNEWQSIPGHGLPVNTASMQHPHSAVPDIGQFDQHTTPPRRGHTGRPSYSGSRNYQNRTQEGDGRLDG